MAGTSIPAGASALLVVVLAIGGSLVAGAYAYQDTPEVTETATETTRINFSVDYQLDPGATWRYDNLTATTEGNNTLTAGSDYRFTNATGTIEWLNSTEVTANESVTVDYTWTRKTEEVQVVGGLLTAAATVASYLPLLVIAAAVLAGVVTFGYAVMWVGGSGGGGYGGR
jgi:hypothetical protein